MRGPGLLIVVACALFVAPARGSVEDWWGAAPSPMRAYRDDGSGRERPRRLELDGMTLAVAAGGTTDEPAEVARYYAAALGDARHGCGARFGDDEHGGVAAIDYGEALDRDALAARMGRLAATGELGALGQLQAVWYERRADGGTRYLNLWGALSLDKLLPADGGDVAGGELEGVPRPAGGARVLSAGERGAAGRVVAYRVPGASAVAVRSDFVDELHARGWRSDDAFARYAAAHERSGERLVRRGRELFVDVGRDGDDVTVVIIEMERRG
jgi:hypothetical protein